MESNIYVTTNGDKVIRKNMNVEIVKVGRFDDDIEIIDNMKQYTIFNYI